MGEKLILGGMFAVGLAAIVGTYLYSANSEPAISKTAAFTVPGQNSMTVDAAHEAFYQVLPSLLLVIYEAFNETEETKIYDTLASVTHGDALEFLYLERVGAMAGGGLEEMDQTIHEIKLLDAQVNRDGATLAIDASWQVIGTVGHAEHLHVRGNTYSADLRISPIEGAWRVDEFTLLDVNRDTAGEIFEAPDAN